MELSEFVTETLVQVQKGVENAIATRAKEPNPTGVINPIFGTNMDAAGYDHVQKLEFDVAVTVTETHNSGGKAGIKVFSIELGGERSKGAEQSTVSRIKFTVPVIPPAQVVTPLAVKF